MPSKSEGRVDVYVGEENKKRWAKYAEEMNMSLSKYVQYCVETVIKITDKAKAKTVRSNREKIQRIEEIRSRQI